MVLNDVDMMGRVEVSIRGVNRFLWPPCLHSFLSLQNHPSPFFTVHPSTIPTHLQMHPTDSTPPVTYQQDPNAYTEWRQYLYQYFTQEYQRSNGTVTLAQIYPIAKKKFASRNKSCDIDLELMANRRKHRKVDRW